MNSHTTPISDDELILLADGELTGSAREDLILRIEKADAWKRCAIFLLQSQTLRSTLGAIQSDLQLPTIKLAKRETDQPGTKSYEVDDPTIQIDTFSGALQPNSSQPITRSRKTPRKANAAKNPALLDTPVPNWSNVPVTVSLVLILLSFIGGFLIGEKHFAASSQTADHTADHPGRFLSLAASTVSKPVFRDPSILAQIHSAVDSVGIEDSEIIALVHVQRAAGQRVFPLIRSHQLSQQIQQTTQPEIPTRFAAQMRRSGWKVQSTKHFVSVHMPDGKSRTFPIGMLNYKFIGNPVF